MIPTERMMNKNYIILSLLVLVKFILQYFAIDPVYELHRDEFLHLDLGRHLAWGYTSVPPATGFISYLIYLLGNHSLLVKFIPALFGALTIVVVWKIVEELGGKLFALTLAGVSVLLSVLLRINTLYQPNSLDILCWTLLFYFVIRYIKTSDSKWIYASGLTFAFGFLNKYNIGFLLLGLAPAILITSHRKVIFNKHFYIAVLISLLVIFPNILWQINNNWPVIHHMKLLASSQLVNVNRADFLIGQLMFFIGAFFVIIFSFISFIIYRPFSKYRIVIYAFFFTMALFVVFKAKSYYTLGLYPLVISFGAVYIEHLLSNGKKYWLKAIFLLVPVVIMISSFKILVPVLSPEEIIREKDIFDNLNLNRWEDGKMHHIPQDYADMLGWKELASYVDSAIKLVENSQNTIVHCDNWGQAGAINYYSKSFPGNAYTMDADYLFWYPLKEKAIKNIILVKESTDDDKSRSRESAFFRKIILIGEIKNSYARERGTRVYLLLDATINVNDVFAEEIENNGFQ